MRKRLLKETHQEFDSGIRRLLPGFEPFQADVRPACRVYSRFFSPSLWVFIVLLPMDKEDHFTLEVGWSEKGTFPGALEQLAVHLFPDPRGTRKQPELVDGGLMFRLKDLVSPPPRQLPDVFWDVITGRRCDDWHFESRPLPDRGRAAECVEDALILVRDHALPYVAKRTDVPIARRYLGEAGTDDGPVS